MEALETTSSNNQPDLFNSDIEAAVRALVILEAIYPRRCNLAELTWLDYVVINTEEFSEGPPSLHPRTRAGVGGLLVRRHIIAAGLKMLRVLHLIEETHGNEGIAYEAGEEALAFLGMLTAPYHIELKKRAKWVGEKFRERTREQIEVEIKNTVGQWTSEMQIRAFPTGSQQ